MVWYCIDYLKKHSFFKGRTKIDKHFWTSYNIYQINYNNNTMASIEVCKQLSTYSIDNKIWQLVDFITEHTTVEEFDNKYQQLSKPSLTAGARCGNTVMTVAAFRGNVVLVEYLHKMGGDKLLNLGNEFGMTPLYYAIKGRQYETAKKLVQLGANVNLATSSPSGSTLTGNSTCHSTPLWMAIHHREGVHAEIVRLLASSGGVANPPLDETHSKILADIL